jgi:tRNA dimethylallyltransferase
MFEGGLVEETRSLLEGGLEAPLTALRAVGYDEAVALVRGGLNRAAAEERTTLRTAQLAKRQRTWFRHQLTAIRLDAGERPAEAIAREIRERQRASG